MEAILQLRKKISRRRFHAFRSFSRDSGQLSSAPTHHYFNAGRFANPLSAVDAGISFGRA